MNTYGTEEVCGQTIFQKVVGLIAFLDIYLIDAPSAVEPAQARTFGEQCTPHK